MIINVKFFRKIRMPNNTAEPLEEEIILELEYDTLQALEQLAQEKNCSVNDLVVEIIQKELQKLSDTADC